MESRRLRHFVVTEKRQEHEILAVVASIAAGSTHPLSRTMTRFAAQKLKGELPTDGATVKTLPGKGLSCEHSDLGTVLVGSRRLMDESQLGWTVVLLSAIAEHRAAQQVFIGWQGRVQGMFCFAEPMRAEAAEALTACRTLGLQLRLLTGDTSQRAEVIGEQLAIDTHSEQLPADKVAAIEDLAARGGVAMVGDGLNDAPALAAASVGVALGCGADVSRDAAGVCLLADDLTRFPWAVALARQTSRIVKQNLFWAFAYNSLGIVLAATGHLNPIWAALAMAVSSLLVVTNSLRLSHFPTELAAPEPSTSLSSEPPAREQLRPSADMGVAPS